LALDAATGNIYTWGKNDAGQLGDGTVIFKRSPVAIARTGSYIAIAAGQSSSYAVDSTGLVFGWGLNTSGEIGNYSVISYSSPVVIAKVSL
jgi:alpha-tubulin suppressor-like RCC1 family protein